MSSEGTAAPTATATPTNHLARNYINNRLESQIDWYSQKSAYNKSRFQLFQIITLIASAIIPIVNIIDVIDFPVRIISSVLSGIIIIVVGMSQIGRYHETWILYRTTLELLKREKYFYENDAGEYSNADEFEKNKLLVERTESILSSELSKYFTIHQLQEKSSRPQENEGASLN